MKKTIYNQRLNAFPNHVTHHFRVLQRYLKGHVTEVGLVVVEVKKGERGEGEKDGLCLHFNQSSSAFTCLILRFYIRIYLEVKTGFK